MATGALCARLANLALLTLVPGGDGGAVTVHDVIRDFLRDELSSARLAQLHQVLLDAAAQGLPTAAEATASGGEVASLKSSASLPSSAASSSRPENLVAAPNWGGYLKSVLECLRCSFTGLLSCVVDTLS